MKGNYISWHEAKPTTKECAKNYGNCGGDVRFVSDPYKAELNDIINNMPICENCYQSLLGAI